MVNEGNFLLDGLKNNSQMGAVEWIDEQKQFYCGCARSLYSIDP